jgi:hypothetical protein
LDSARIARYYGANATSGLYFAGLIALAQGNDLAANSKFAAGASGAAGLGAPNLMWALERLGVPIPPTVAIFVAIGSGLALIIAVVLCLMILRQHFAGSQGRKMLATILMTVGGLAFAAGVYLTLVPGRLEHAQAGGPSAPAPAPHAVPQQPSSGASVINRGDNPTFYKNTFRGLGTAIDNSGANPIFDENSFIKESGPFHTSKSHNNLCPDDNACLRTKVNDLTRKILVFRGSNDDYQKALLPISSMYIEEILYRLNLPSPPEFIGKARYNPTLKVGMLVGPNPRETAVEYLQALADLLPYKSP